MSERSRSGLDINAPHPWRIVDHTGKGHGYISIVDDADIKICDLFPFAGKSGRGKEATMALAETIIGWARKHLRGDER
jgi:hypothetical protein